MQKEVMDQMDELIAFNCASTIAKVKPSSIVTIAHANFKFEHIEECLKIYNKKFEKQGIIFTRLCYCNKYSLIMIYVKKQLEELLETKEVEEFLNESGYNDCQGMQKKLKRLSQKMETFQEFPHEIGAFLGYPLEDVRGFVRKKGSPR